MNCELCGREITASESAEQIEVYFSRFFIGSDSMDRGYTVKRVCCRRCHEIACNRIMNILTIVEPDKEKEARRGADHD